MAITLRDVAARAGVSAITVSRALNNTGYVSLETRERVNAAVAELNYVPNAVASSLRSNKTQLLALLLTDITNLFWTTVMTKLSVLPAWMFQPNSNLGWKSTVPSAAGHSPEWSLL